MVDCWRAVLVIEDLLSPDEVTSLAERTDAIARGETGNPTEVLQIEPSVDRAELSPEERVLAVRKLFNLCDTDEPMFQHASNPKIVDVIADLLGTEDIKVYGDQLCACISDRGHAECQHCRPLISCLPALSHIPGILACLGNSHEEPICGLEHSVAPGLHVMAEHFSP